MLWRGPFGGGAASGKVGAMVAAHNTGGQYVRSRTTPTNPNSVFQQEVRNAVRSLTARWGQIDQSQREAWDVYDANVTVRNRLGDNIHIGALPHYIRSNTPRIQANLPVIDDAPTVFDLGEVQDAVIQFTPGEDGTGTLTLDAGANWITSATGSENSMLVYLSRPQNPAINFFKGPYRFTEEINSVTASSGTATFSMPFEGTANINQIFGYVRITRGDGRLSSTYEIQSYIQP